MSGPKFLPEALKSLARADPRLSPWMKEYGAPTYTRTKNPYQSLSRSIIYQQLHGKAAGTIYNRFVDLFPGPGFPEPAQVAKISMPKLRSAGLSQAKATYLKELAKFFAAGKIEPRRFGKMSDDEIRAALVEVKGIGNWSVDMFLMFGLNRPDILPVGDFAVRKGMAHFFGKDLPLKDAQLIELAQPWRPFRSVASWYMWRVCESL